MRAYNLRSALQKPEFITGLFLNHMELQEIPTEVFALPNLRELDLSFNKIPSLPSTIGQFTKLERLVLSNNQIRQLPFEFVQLVALRDVRLDHNPIQTWPEVFFQLPLLEKIDLSFNQIALLPHRFLPLHELRDLSLAHNDIVKLPAGLGGWSSLRTLNLSHNRLSRLPADIADCKELDHLNLENNRLHHLPSTFEHFEKLRWLNIDNNAFQELPGIIFSNLHLRHLSAAGNRISTLPRDIVRLPWLSHLDLSRNRLATLPELLADCHQLQVLLLEKNQLTRLPPLSSLSRLRRLNVDHNALKALPPLPSSLKIMTASRNLLTTCPEFIGHLPLLEWLDLSYNALFDLPESFHQLQQLQTLDLRKTHLTQWPPQLIQLNNLKTLKTDWQASVQKSFFRLLQACVKVKAKAHERQQFFQLLHEEKAFAPQLSLQCLFQAANLKLPELRRIARTELFRRFGSDTFELKTSSSLCILGKTATPPEVMAHRLHQQQVTARNQPHSNTTCILLGEFPDWFPILERLETIYLSEHQVIDWLDRQEEKYLQNAVGSMEIERLRTLLLHQDPVNVTIAVQLLQGGGVPTELLTELFIAWKTAKPGKLRTTLKKLLWQYSPESARHVLEAPISLSPNQPPALLRAHINRICTDTPFEEEKILRYCKL